MKRTHLSRIRFAGGESYPPAQFIVRRNMKTKSLTKRSFAVVLTTILLLIALPVATVLAADTGFQAPSSNNVQGIGSSGSWQNPQNGYTSNNFYATIDGTKWVEYGTFNIAAIPVGSTIDGIQVSVEGSTTGRQANIDLSW